VRRWLYSGATLAILVGTASSGILPANAAGPKTFKIGVDNAAPKGHNWLYVDFFPRQGVKVHRGDVVDFSWNKGSLDGAHTVALLPSGASPLPLVTPDTDDGPAQLEGNPAVFGPSDPTCGSAANPCAYNGSKRVTSGFAPNAPGNEFFVKLNLPASKDPVAVNFFCELHPGMQGSVTVVPDATPRSTPDQVEDAAQAQFRADTKAAFDTEEDVESHAVGRDSDGNRTVTVIAGTATQYVEIAEMLPRRVKIDGGDKVKYVTRTIRDVHTVTFPQGAGSNGVDPIVNVCEASPVDTPASSPFSCASPADFETHINPQPQGATVITSKTTVGSSGIIGAPTPPFPNTFTFTFPNEGTFAYQCRIHDHMVGTVIVKD
jgi:plastocyanin